SGSGLCRFEGLSLRRAHEAVLEQRPFIRPNAGFWRQLMEYERSLFGRNTMRMVSTPGGVLPEALRLPEDLPEALRLPEDPEPAYCLNI
ncbi:dual specificity protein phosphatase 14-like, partial [Notothenia coriiceps]|uniref:Dual specificity protein phosphatase 14-like n=1 Tax=Notothenia coriiceps TaxID=8208 RepID=A0A6I9PW50_9TELE